jgi:predicted RNase H-like nuclease (RuvC/YqgF family)
MSLDGRVRFERLQHERNQLLYINREMAGELSKLRAALERIAANTCCDKGQEAALVAREALEGHINSDGLAGGAARLSHRGRVRKWYALWR